MTDVLAEQARADRLRQADINHFLAQDVPPLALARSCWDTWAFIGRDRVVLEDGGRFAFARHQPEAEAIDAYTLVLFDMAGDPADILAITLDWRPALWLGSVAMAGEEQILAPRLGGPLEAHATVLGWLRSERRGIAILSHAKAAERLHGVPLGVASVEHAQLLRRKLARPAPDITVQRGATVARAA